MPERCLIEGPGGGPCVYKPPSPIPLSAYPMVFLAGSIEMGKAVDWQKRAEGLFLASGWSVMNPRRDDWDDSWEQKIENTKFREQVTWELKGLEEANAVIFYFAPGTMSPISLLELGLRTPGRILPASLERQKIVVVCPEGFWRKGNVDIVCARYGVVRVETIEEAVATITGKVVGPA